MERSGAGREPRFLQRARGAKEHSQDPFHFRRRGQRRNKSKDQGDRCCGPALGCEVGRGNSLRGLCITARMGGGLLCRAKLHCHFGESVRRERSYQSKEVRGERWHLLKRSLRAKKER